MMTIPQEKAPAPTGAADRPALALQFHANVLTVALQNIGHLERAALFFQQSLFENPAAPAASTQSALAAPKP